MLGKKRVADRVGDGSNEPTGVWNQSANIAAEFSQDLPGIVDLPEEPAVDKRHHRSIDSLQNNDCGQRAGGGGQRQEVVAPMRQQRGKKAEHRQRRKPRK